MNVTSPKIQKQNTSISPNSPVKPVILSRISLKNKTQSFANFMLIRQKVKRRTLYHVTAEDFNEKDCWKRRLINLKRIFTQHKLLTHLKFTSYLNSNTKIGSLSHTLKKFKSLKAFKLSFGSSPKVNMSIKLQELLRSLRRLSLLTDLNIDFTHCKGFNINHLLTVLKSQLRLANLQLKNFLSTEISNKKFKHLMSILKDRRELKSIEFSFSNINDKQCQILCQELCEYKSLTHLSLKFNGCNSMTIEGLHSLSLLLKHPQLILLDLSFIGCQELGEEILFPALENMIEPPPSLGYPFQDYAVTKRQIHGGYEDIRETKISLSCPPFLQNQYAQKINIYHAYQDFSEGYAEWVNLDFPLLSSLKSLDLYVSHKGTSKIISGDILKRVGVMMALESFKLTCHSYNLTSEGLTSFTQSLQNLTSLNRLEITFSACSYISEKEIYCLVLGLKELKALKSLALALIKCQFGDSIFESLAILGTMEWLKALNVILRKSKTKEKSWFAQKFKKSKAEIFFKALENLKELERMELSLGYFNVTDKEFQILQSSIKKIESLKERKFELYFDELKSGFESHVMRGFKAVRMKYSKKESIEDFRCLEVDLGYQECLYKMKIYYLEEKHEDISEPSKILEKLLHFFLTGNSKTFQENLASLLKLSKLAQSKSKIVFLEISVPFDKSVQDLKILSRLIPNNLSLRYSINIEENEEIRC